MSYKFDIVIDTREKIEHALNFVSSKINNIYREKLETGDYSIKGLENILCIERKASLAEFYKNITEARFWNEMQRMGNYKYRFLILQFTTSDIQAVPYSLNVPKSSLVKMKITPQYIFRCISDIQVKYNVSVIFADNRNIVEQMILNVMKRVYEAEQ